MKNLVKIEMLVVVSVITLLSSSASLLAGTCTWTGGADDGNKWSTAGNWQDSVLPTADDKVVFNVSEATTISVDAAGCACQYIEINQNSKALSFDGTETLTLTRNGNSATVVNNNRGIYATTFNCPVFNSNSGTSSDGRATFLPGCVYNGKVTLNGGLVSFNDANPAPSEENAKTVFRGGLVSVCTRQNGNYIYPNHVNNAVEIDFADPTMSMTSFKCVQLQGGVVRILSGSFVVNGAEQNTSVEDSRLEIGGGSFTAGTSSLGTRLVFKDGLYKIGSVNTTGAETTPNQLGFTDGVLAAGCETCYTLVNGSTAFVLFAPGQPDELTLNGVLTATNSTASGGYPVPYFCLSGAARSTITGSGAFWSRGIAFSGGTSKTSPLTLSGITLVLGDGGIASPSAWYQALRFDGATLKGYADFSGIRGKGSHSVILAGKTTVDTADARDKSVARTFDLTSSTTTVIAEPNLELDVKGGGTLKFNWATDIEQTCASLHVGEDTSLVLGGAVPVSLGSLVLEDGAQLTLQASARGNFDIDQFSLTGSATLTVTIPSGTVRPLIPVILGGKLTADGLTVVLDNNSSTDYAATVMDGNLYIHTDAVAPTAGAVEWTGSGDGVNWSDPYNWVVAPESGLDASVYFNGLSNLDVTVDQADLSFKQLVFRSSAAGFKLSGEGLTLTSATSGDNSAIRLSGSVPVTIANDLILTGSGTAFTTAAESLLTLSGIVTGPNGLLSLDGVVSFAGTATFKKLSFMRGHSDSKLIVENGGLVNLTGTPDLRAGVIIVKEGGTLDLTASCADGWNWTESDCDISLDGLIRVANGFGASTTSDQKARFNGKGRLDIGYTTIPAETGWRGEMVGVTVNVAKSWATTVPGKEAYAAALTLNGGSLGAKGDFTYGVAEDADVSLVTTAPADRALVLTGACAIDTQDPDTGDAHTITFSDPIDGSSGSLVKKGAGDLVLMADSSSATNDFAHGLTIEAGRLVFAGPCTNVIAGGVKISGGGMGISRSARNLCSGWTTLMKAVSVEGNISDPKGKAEFRVVEGDGCVEIQAKALVKGMILFVE